jgi:prepilin peptidase CpaA
MPVYVKFTVFHPVFGHAGQGASVCRDAFFYWKILGLPVLNTLPIVIFSAAMIFAAFCDLTTMTIPNWLNIGLALAFFLFALLLGLPMQTLAIHSALGLAALIAGMGFFFMGWIGGGDAKLIAASALWVGADGLLSYLVVASLLGGALTLGLLMFRTMPLPLVLVRQGWIARLHEKREGIPYGIALAAAGLLVFPDTDFFRLTVSMV